MGHIDPPLTVPKSGEGSGVQSYALSPSFDNLGTIDADLIPLYAVLGVMHRTITSVPRQSAVLASWQLQRALAHLGLDGQILMTQATVVISELEAHRIGKRTAAPTIRRDGKSDAHAVLWVASRS